MKSAPLLSELSSLRVLFVCTGNICRSPTAEAILRDEAMRRGLSSEIVTDSAGTHCFGFEHPADERARAAAAKRDIDLTGIVSRPFEAEDFERYNLILVADQFHHDHVEAMRPPGNDTAVMRMLDFLPEDNPLSRIRDIPDPYYGGYSGFERVLELLIPACSALLDAWQSRKNLDSPTRISAG